MSGGAYSKEECEKKASRRPDSGKHKQALLRLLPTTPDPAAISQKRTESRHEQYCPSEVQECC